MAQFDLSVRKLFRRYFVHSIRGRAVIHHFAFSQGAGISMSDITAFAQSGDTLLFLVTAAAQWYRHSLRFHTDFHRKTLCDLGRRLVISILVCRFMEHLKELLFDFGKLNA